VAKLLNLRSRIPTILAVSLALGFLSLAPMFGWLLLRGSPPLRLDCFASSDKDIVWTYRLLSAWELEGNGNVDQAAKEYRSVLESNNDCVRNAALGRLQRISRIRERLGFAYSIITGVADASARSRSTLVAVLVLIAVPWVIVGMVPRRGTQIAGFPVYGCKEEAASRLFRDALVWFANEIKRVYGSEYAKSVGITLLFDDLKGQPLEGGTATEGDLAEVKDPDTKTAVHFALTRVIRLLRDATERPLLIIEGDVRLFPGDAKAVGIIKNASTGEEIRIEAYTKELGEIPGWLSIENRLVNPPVTPLQVSPSSIAEESRQMSKQLYVVALLLACKIRFAQLKEVNVGYKPNSWKTVCLFTAAALGLE